MNNKEAALKYPGLQHQPDQGKSPGKLRQVIRRFLRAQFGCPTGLWGNVAGTIMARAPSNQDRIRWTLSLLDLRPDDRVLEIGFGPGFAVQEASKVVTGGIVAGVDHSEVMVHHANKRNAIAIHAGKVDLKLGSASSLPKFSEPFDKIFTINSIHFWTDSITCLKNLRELLKPGGLIAVTIQPRSRGSTNETTEAIGRELVMNLAHAGFSKVRLEIKPAQPAPIACALGIR
jgi:SAM-dependent methyltransferase